jgi:hypothetical protein
MVMGTAATNVSPRNALNLLSNNVLLCCRHSFIKACRHSVGLRLFDRKINGATLNTDRQLQQIDGETKRNSILSMLSLQIGKLTLQV